MKAHTNYTVGTPVFYISNNGVTTGTIEKVIVTFYKNSPNGAIQRKEEIVLEGETTPQVTTGKYFKSKRELLSSL